MCGRARCTLRPDDFPRACHLNGRRVRHIDMNRYQPSYNVSPGFNVPVVRREDDLNDDGAVVHCMKWGLVPSFTKKTEKPDHYKMFNARSESIKAKASFRRLVPKNRCLVAVEGFYEWKNDGSKKQPYYIHFKDGQPLVFAALYDSWKNPEGEQLKANETRSIAQFFSKKGDKDELGQKSHIKVAEEEILNTDQTESLKQEPESGHVGHLCSPVRPESFTSTRATDIKVEQDYDESGSKQSSTWQTGNPPEKVGILANDNVKSLEEVETEDIKPNVFGLPWEESGDSKTKRDYEEFSRNVMRLAKRVYKHLSPSKKKAKGAGDKQPTLFSYFGKG